MWAYSWIKDNTKLIRKRAVHRARLSWGYHVRRRRAGAPVFILATRRTGSNLLISYLNSIPGVRVANEILHPTMAYGIRRSAISKRAVLRHIRQSVADCRQPLSGAKMILGRMRHHRIGIADLTELFPRARFVLLYRRSLLEQYLSLKLAERTGVWQTDRPLPPPEPPAIDALDFRAYAAGKRQLYADALRQLRDAPFVTVTYEELAEDPEAVFRDVLRPFLGLPATTIATPLKKQNPSAGFSRDLDEVRDDLGGYEPFQDYSAGTAA